jgi:hypothetical protein
MTMAKSKQDDTVLSNEQDDAAWEALLADPQNQLILSQLAQAVKESGGLSDVGEPVAGVWIEPSGAEARG